MRILFKILCSLLLVIFILSILEQCIGFGIKNNINYKISYITNNYINADILVHGPCEPEWMIDPEVIEKYIPYKVYNLSLNHSDFADNYIFLKQYLEHQSKPKAVLLYVTPESFDSVVANTFNTYRFAHLIVDSEIKQIVKDLDKDYGELSIIPFYKYSVYSNFLYYKAVKGWMDYIFQNRKPVTMNGHIHPSHPWHASFKNYRDLNPKKGYFLWSSLREKYFVNIIKLLKSKSIALIIYESPIYYEALPLQRNRQSHLRKIDSICNSYNIPYLRFDTLTMKYDKKNYFTTYNMTMDGNKIFNPLFGKILQDTLPYILNKQRVKFK